MPTSNIYIYIYIYIYMYCCHKSLGEMKGAQSNFLLMMINLGKHGTQVKRTIPDIRHGENQGLRILGNESNTAGMNHNQ